MRKKNWVGLRFARLLVLKEDERNKSRKTKLICRCDCGAVVTVDAYNLANGHTQSCGCLQKERARRSATVHGESRSRLHRTWAHMKERCLNPSAKEYKYYGARGVTVCREWMQFSTFMEWAKNTGYNDTLTIERIDVNGNYCPENCTWIPHGEQAANKRTNHLFTINEETHTITEWARKFGIKPTTVFCRLYDGWDEMSALTRPARGVNEDGKV